MEVKIVVGANYGDEGKGMATAYFSKQAYENKQRCLNILYNGSCQRGHTVELKNGTKHVFHHFGSGTFYGAHTYFDRHFIINPIFFVREYYELAEKGYEPICYANEDCTIATPFDAILNQIFERGRGKNKHGSCGFGVFETVKRNENKEYCLTYRNLALMTREQIKNALWKIVREYVPKRLKEMGYEDIPETERNVLGGELTDNLINHYIQDFYTTINFCWLINFEKIFVEDYDVVVYEGAQGLALDMNNLNDFPHLTPSETTPVIPMKAIVNNKWKIGSGGKIEICYVTRSYMTRHGAGPFPTECKKEDINKNIEDLTNVPNPFQDTLRYGTFDPVLFEIRVKTSIGDACEIWGGFDLKATVFLTYANDNPKQKNMIRGLLGDMFDYGYVSNTKYLEDVKGWRD